MTFGPLLAGGLRRRAPQPGDVWHAGKVRVVIRGSVHWLRRAVGRHGVVPEAIVQCRRDARAARRPLRALLEKQGCRPRRIVTDKRASHPSAKRAVAPSLEHRARKGLNKRAENSRLPPRKRERQM